MEFTVIIPVRWASIRLPGKVLMDIGGKPMLQHVYERSKKSGADLVVIATDDERIAKAAEGFGAQVVMTAADHATGTERIAEAAATLELEDHEIIVGVQGDEPLIPPSVIRQLAEDLHNHDNVKVVTVCEPIKKVEVLYNPNIAKVVMNKRNYALYFSRAPIPWERETFADRDNVEMKGHHYRHVGIYAYRACFLQDYISWEPSQDEELESLEQLRMLWHGCRIHMHVTKLHVPPGVDNEKGLARVRKIFASKQTTSST